VDLKFTPLRVALLVLLLGGFWFVGGYSIPEELPSGLFRTWALMILLFVLGAVMATVVDHWIGVLDRTNLRWFYVVVGIAAMLGAGMYLHVIRERVKIEGGGEPGAFRRPERSDMSELLVSVVVRAEALPGADMSAPPQRPRPTGAPRKAATCRRTPELGVLRHVGAFGLRCRPRGTSPRSRHVGSAPAPPPNRSPPESGNPSPHSTPSKAFPDQSSTMLVVGAAAGSRRSPSAARTTAASRVGWNSLAGWSLTKTLTVRSRSRRAS